MNWKLWGPYVSERQWGSVREHYGSSDVWNDFSHDMARSRAYRWAEDGIAGICDDHQLLCLAVSMYNERDDIIKERLFGFTNSEGNHGEDVKEYYFYLDNTPTHSYMKYLYKYPYEYPYRLLLDNRDSLGSMEYELLDTGALNDNRYFDVLVEYCKNTAQDILMRITVTNQGPETRPFHLLPTLWFRNTWSWGPTNEPKPSLRKQDGRAYNCIETEQPLWMSNKKVTMRFYCDKTPDILFTENETDNTIFRNSDGSPCSNKLGSQYFKNGINNYIVGAFGPNRDLNIENRSFIQRSSGTKASAHYQFTLESRESTTVCLRLTENDESSPFGSEFKKVFNARIQEADEFYDACCPYSRSGSDYDKDMYNIFRQSCAGMLWTKQFYHLIAMKWIKGDNGQTPARSDTNKMENGWEHLYFKDILSVPDKWEFAALYDWDLAFHTATLALVDPHFAKKQVQLLMSDWSMRPNGQIPATEWKFDTPNPPVHAWAAYTIYQREKQMLGIDDIGFLERIFVKLNINFDWWVNRNDGEDNFIFEAGFMGLDNIRPMSDVSGIEKADSTGWMAMYCLNMLKISLELYDHTHSKQYLDLSRKYLFHFLNISAALNKILWHGDFYYDKNKECSAIYSCVGLIPMFAIEEIQCIIHDPDSFATLEGMIQWYKEKGLISDDSHVDVTTLVESIDALDDSTDSIINGTVAAVGESKLRSLLKKALDPNHLLSPFGIRSLSKSHNFNSNNNFYYTPAEATDKSIMGGNTNWRGPLFFSINYLIIEALRKYHAYLGSEYQVSYPTTLPNVQANLENIANDLSLRLIRIFLKKSIGRSQFANDPLYTEIIQNPALKAERPFWGGAELFNKFPQFDPSGSSGWCDPVLFNEYFHGDNGAGLGANHQTGWTGLVANLIQEMGVFTRMKSTAADMPQDIKVPYTSAGKTHDMKIRHKKTVTTISKKPS
ncbi:glucosidase [bacterium]|nr:glucosidase [candidate division CSSED10-310 bacterium]